MTQPHLPPAGTGLAVTGIGREWHKAAANAEKHSRWCATRGISCRVDVLSSAARDGGVAAGECMGSAWAVRRGRQTAASESGSGALDIARELVRASEVGVH
jgi:hypothetical protein